MTSVTISLRLNITIKSERLDINTIFYYKSNVRFLKFKAKYFDIKHEPCFDRSIEVHCEQAIKRNL